MRAVPQGNQLGHSACVGLLDELDRLRPVVGALQAACELRGHCFRRASPRAIISARGGRGADVLGFSIEARCESGEIACKTFVIEFAPAPAR